MLTLSLISTIAIILLVADNLYLRYKVLKDLKIIIIKDREITQLQLMNKIILDKWSKAIEIIQYETSKNNQE